MAVRVSKIEYAGTNMKEAKVSLFADAKTDVTSDMDIIGLPETVTDFTPGSVVVTADADVAFYKSDGNWNWV